MTYYAYYQKYLVYSGTAIETLPSGMFKAIVYGSPMYHMMSWSGENIHKLTISDQPLRGYKTAIEALTFIFTKFKSENEVEQWCNSRKMAGKWHTGNGWYFINFEKQNAVMYTTPPGTNLKTTEICLK
jgi:hypothetical protein